MPAAALQSEKAPGIGIWTGIQASRSASWPRWKYRKSHGGLVIQVRVSRNLPEVVDRGTLAHGGSATHTYGAQGPNIRHSPGVKECLPYRVLRVKPGLGERSGGLAGVIDGGPRTASERAPRGPQIEHGPIAVDKGARKAVGPDGVSRQPGPGY